MKTLYKTSMKRLRDAHKRNKKNSSRGCDAEHSGALLDEFARTKILRMRANCFGRM